MAKETGTRDHATSQADAGVKRRGLLRFGTLITAFTGASAISAIGASRAEAGPGDKTPTTAYVPTAEKGAPLGVATLDTQAKIPQALLPDLSATYAGKGASNTFTGRQNLPDGLVLGSPTVSTMPPGAIRGLVPMSYDDNPGDNIAYNFQSIVFGDWTLDSGIDPGFVWGTNFYTVTGTSAGSANGVTYMYGGLIEADVRAPAGSQLGIVIGLQAEAAFAHAASGATVDEMRSLLVAAPVRKDGATAGTATKSYGIYVQKVSATAVGATEAYSIYVQGGLTRLTGRTEINSEAAGDVGLIIKQFPSATADAFRITDTFGNVKVRMDQFGQIASSNNHLAYEGQAGQTIIGRVGPTAGSTKEAGISMGAAGDAKLYRRAAGVISTVNQQVIATGSGTTAQRPDAATVGVAAQYYDTTITKPIWSDGTVWRDAMGTAV